MGFLREQLTQSAVQQPGTFIPTTQVPSPGMTPEMNERQMEIMRQMMLTNMSGIEGREPGDVIGPMPSTTESAALLTNRPRVTPKGYRL